MITAEKLMENVDVIKEEMKVKTDTVYIDRYKDSVSVKSVDIERAGDVTVDNNKFVVQRKLCYEGITEPNLRDKKLWEQYGVTIGNPSMIVKKLFKPYEIEKIADKISEISDYVDNSKKEKEDVEKAKN